MIKYLKQTGSDKLPYYAIAYGEHDNPAVKGTKYRGILFDHSGLAIPVDMQLKFYEEVTEDEFFEAVPMLLVQAHLRLKRELNIMTQN